MSEPLVVADTKAEAMERAQARMAELRRERVAREVERRIRMRQKVEGDRRAQAVVKAACEHDPARFISDWVWTYDPRNAGTDLPTKVPFVLRPKQCDLVAWLREHQQSEESGIIEKSREEGASFVVLAYLLHQWLFAEGFSGAVGSYKLEKVDKIGDMDALFPKLRYMLYALPGWMRPAGFDRNEHDNYCRLVNPARDGAITGESGSNMGRGGRATMYVIDEWAFVDRQEAVNRAISETSRCRIKLSTPNGVGDKMYEERHSGMYDVFTMHWRDNPAKNYTAAYVDESGDLKHFCPWYERKKQDLDPVTLAQEVDIDYSASAEGIVIPSKWVQAAIEYELGEGAVCAAGLDVSEGGTDATVYACRRGGKVVRVAAVSGADTGAKASNAEDLCRADKVDRIYYDRLGVGSGITATLKRREDSLPFEVHGVANSEKPSTRKFDDAPKVPCNERFANYAAELWWALRLRFKATYERVEGIQDHPDEDCISIPNRSSLIAQLSQPTYSKNSKDKIKVDKKGKGSQSPDEAESVMYAFATPRQAGASWSEFPGIKANVN